MFCITLIIFFGSYKFISFDIFFVFCSSFLWSNSLTIFIDVVCNYFCRSSSFLLVDVNSITVFISFSFYKLIAIYILLRIVTLCRFRNFISIFIYIFSNYLCSRRSSFLLVDVNSITVFISFSFYKLIAIYILLRIVTLCRFRNFISIFIYIFSNYLCSRRSSFLLVDVNSITVFISFSFYKFISINIFFVFCSIFLWSNSLTIFIDVFCYYFCWSSFWSEFPCSCEFNILVIYSFLVFVIFYKFPCSIFNINCCCSRFCWCYYITFNFSSLFCW